MLWIHLPTGAGGLVLNYLLFAGRLVPRPIAVLGFAGYTLLLSGAVGLLGLVDMNNAQVWCCRRPVGSSNSLSCPSGYLPKGFQLPAARG